MPTTALQIKFCKQCKQPGGCGTSAAEHCLLAACVPTAQLWKMAREACLHTSTWMLGKSNSNKRHETQDHLQGGSVRMKWYGEDES